MSIHEAVFTSRYAWNAERMQAMAIYCSDGRWGEAFDEFCHDYLHIPRYDRFAVPGGPAWLALGDRSKKDVDFLVRAHRLQRIVLITHYGCAFYAERLRQTAEVCLHAQAADLHTGAGGLRARYPGIQVEAYLAMRTGESLSFHPVDV